MDHKNKNNDFPRDKDNPLRPEKIMELLNNPELRFVDDPGSMSLGQLLSINPEPYLQELFGLVVNDKVTQAMMAGDAFLANYPPKGQMPVDMNFIWVGMMLTGEPVGFSFARHDGNLGLHGPTGSAKSSWLKLVLPQVALRSKVIVFEHKENLRELVALTFLAPCSWVFTLDELQIALLEPPPGVPEHVWEVELTDLIARNYGLQASRRLLLDCITKYDNQTPQGKSHFSGLLRTLMTYPEGRGYRIAGYKEAASAVLKKIILKKPVS